MEIGHQVLKEISFAFQLNQSLQSGDKLAIGYGDPDLNNNMSSTDGYILEFEPDLDDNEAYFSMYRNGTVVSNGGERMLVKLERSLTDWSRLAIHFNWYNVGNAILTETYTKGGEQLNPTQAKIVPDFKKGPQEGNKRLYFSIQDGGNGLELETGSVGVVTLGDVTEIRRTKAFWHFNKSLSSANTWVPLTALRVDPNKRNATVDITSLEILGHSTSDDLALICKAFDNTNVTFTGNESWGIADHITGANSATQERTDIDQFSDDSGTLVNNTTTPGGYKLADSLSSSSGGGQSASKSVSGGEISLKRSIFNSDVAVIMGNSGSTGGVAFEVTVSEDW